MPKQLGVDPELGSIIRTSSNGLTYEIRIIELIEKGLEYESVYGRNGNGHVSLHMPAYVGTLMPTPAPPRNELHAERPKEKSA